MKITTKEIAIIEKPIASLEITDTKTLSVATEYLSKANKMLDALTEDKEALTKPINSSLKAIRAKYKPLEDSLNAVIDDLRQKMSVYQMEALRLRTEQEQAITKRIGEGRGKIHLETALDKIDSLNEVDKQIQTDTGSVKFGTVKHFEVVDMTLLPLKYHLADNVAIRKEMLDGHELTGVKYWTEQNVINSR